MSAFAPGVDFAADAAVVAADVNTKFTNAVSAVRNLNAANFEANSIPVSACVRQKGNGVLHCDLSPTGTSGGGNLWLSTTPGDVLVRRLKASRSQVQDILITSVACWCQALVGTVTVQLALSADGVVFSAVGPALTFVENTAVLVEGVEIPVGVDRHLFVVVTFDALGSSVTGGVFQATHTTRYVTY